MYDYEESFVRELGPCTYREVAFDDSGNWEVDILDLACYGGQWYILSATGCSCWSGEYDLGAGPFATLDDLRAHVTAEYGNEVSGHYYKALHESFMAAIDLAGSPPD